MTKKIDAYKWEPVKVRPHGDKNIGGYVDGAMLPMKCSGENAIEWGAYEMLDNITLFVESGQATQDGWLMQLFATKKDYKAFCEELIGYSEIGRIYDRWYEALGRLASYPNEENFITGEEIVEGLNEHLHETGQL